MKQRDKNRLPLLESASVTVMVIAAATAPRPVGAQTPLTTAFTYQGELLQGGNAVNETCDFRFSLWNDLVDPDPSAQVGSTIVEPVAVDNGLFTVQLDFGSGVFDGERRWLEIAVCCPSPCADFTTLPPRQELTASPYSLRAWNGVGGPDAVNVTADGDVGIGTPIPATKLDVDGDVNIAGDLTGGTFLRAWQYDSSETLTTTSTTWVDTDMIITETTGASQVLLMFSGTAWNNDGNPSVLFVFNIDGVDVTSAIAGNVHKNLEGSFPVSAQWLTTVPAGEHTFKVRWRVGGGTGYMSTGTHHRQFQVVELR